MQWVTCTPSCSVVLSCVYVYVLTYVRSVYTTGVRRRAREIDRDGLAAANESFLVPLRVRVRVRVRVCVDSAALLLKQQSSSFYYYCVCFPCSLLTTTTTECVFFSAVCLLFPSAPMPAKGRNESLFCCSIRLLHSVYKVERRGCRRRQGRQRRGLRRLRPNCCGRRSLCCCCRRCCGCSDYCT